MRHPRWPAFVLLVTVSVAGACGGGSKPKPGPSTTTSTHVVVDADQLPGIQDSAPPWPAELDHLRARLDAIHIPALTQEGSAMDMHIHLSVAVDGQPVTVPAGVGLNGQEVNGGKMVTGFVSPLHTHDPSGLIHVHSPTVREFTIGDIFDVWGVRLTATCLGSSCTTGDASVRVFLDGKPVTDWRRTPLHNQARVVVTYGTEAQLPDPIPSKFGEV